MHDIHAMDYVPKPDPRSYAALCERHAIDPETALFVEDMARNLEPAKALGMTTVWVDNGSERGGHGADPAFIDYRIADIGAWPPEILGEQECSMRFRAPSSRRGNDRKSGGGGREVGVR